MAISPQRYIYCVCHIPLVYCDIHCPFPHLLLSLPLHLYLYHGKCTLSSPPSLSLSATPSLCACMQMDELDPTDELDEIALNALRQIGSQATTGQYLHYLHDIPLKGNSFFFCKWHGLSCVSPGIL